MSTLKNFPLISQLTLMSWDGSSPNRQFDCVPTCILASMMYHEGIAEVNIQWNPDRLLDMAYPEGYQGGTAAAAYVNACAKLGYRLYPLDGVPGHLVDSAHTLLAKGKPVIFTEPDPYSTNPNYSHVCVFFADSADTLTCLDPYIDRAITRPNAEWIGRLLFNQVWIVEPLSEERSTDEMPVILDISKASGHFTEVDREHWQSKKTGKIIQYGMLKAYQAYGNYALCGLTYLGLPLSNEIPTKLSSSIVKQFFQRGVLAYDTAHRLDNPPGAEGVYPLHLYDGGEGSDPAIADLEKQLNTLRQTAQVDPKLAKYEQLLTQIHELSTF